MKITARYCGTLAIVAAQPCVSQACQLDSAYSTSNTIRRIIKVLNYCTQFLIFNAMMGSSSDKRWRQRELRRLEMKCNNFIQSMKDLYSILNSQIIANPWWWSRTNRRVWNLAISPFTESMFSRTYFTSWSSIRSWSLVTGLHPLLQRTTGH